MKRAHGIPGLALAVLLAGSAGLVTTACSTNVSAGRQIDDAVITAAIKTKLAADTDVAAHNIDVDTNEGVVTLSGRVDTRDAKRQAEAMALNTDGVRRVINNLSVGDATGG
ncbi:MAG TPA: BON domain-containing protein [Thermoanaerobaculia bacterium]|nr:BON domain-containing protein [Thermoanaerobaculia bacterium]